MTTAGSASQRRPRLPRVTGGSIEGVVMCEHKPGGEEHRHESPLLRAQEHKGYGDDEGEREEILEGEEDEEPETTSD